LVVPGMRMTITGFGENWWASIGTTWHGILSPARRRTAKYKEQ